MNQNTIKVIISGYGKMGHEVEKMLNAYEEYQIMAIADSQESLQTNLKTYKPDIVIDFSTPDAAFANAKTIIDHKVHPVIGTTGFTPAEIQTLQQTCAEIKLGGVIAPNFSIATVLMMKYAAEIAKHMPQVEIIEKHHETKLDAPSGTAIKTAELIAAQHTATIAENPFKETIPHVRGGLCEKIRIHSVRLPGFIAAEDIIFGGHGETLTLSHQTISREAFMPGLHLACQKVRHLKHLVYGLEIIL